MVVTQHQSAEDMAFAGLRDMNSRQQEVVDRATRQLSLDQVLDVSMLRRLGGHGWCGRGPKKDRLDRMLVQIKTPSNCSPPSRQDVA